MNETTLVIMQARVVTDGNPEDEREKTTRQVADPNRILSAKTLQEAIDYFIKETRYVDYVTRFDYFQIRGQRYDADYWNNK